METLLEDMLALKTSVEDLSANRGGGPSTTATKTSALHYAHDEIGEEGVLLTIHGAGRLRTLSVRADGIPVAFRIFVDGNMLDERTGEDIEKLKPILAELYLN